MHRGLDYVGVVGIVDDGDDNAAARTFWNELYYGPGWTVRLEACNLLLGPDEPVDWKVDIQLFKEEDKLWSKWILHREFDVVFQRRNA